MGTSKAGKPRSIVFLGTAHDNGGSSILASNLAAVMRAEGHHVEEWYLFNSPGHHAPGTRIFLDRQRARSPWTLVTLFVRVVVALWKLKPDAVFGLQSLANLITGVGGALAGVHNRVPTYHSAIQHQNASLMKIDRVVGRLGFYTRIIACAETVAETFVPNGPTYAKHIEVIVNGQKQPKKFSRSDARSEFDLAPDATVIGQIGRFSPQKNQAFSLGLLKDIPYTTLLFVGSGPDQANVKTLVEAKGLAGRVRFVDAIDYARVGIFFAAVDAVLFPSRFEGLSLAAIEAIHCDVPPICSDIPSFREMFRTSSYLTEKLLASLDDRNAWLERIHAVLPGGAERQRVLTELAKLSPAYTFDTMAKRYLAVLD